MAASRGSLVAAVKALGYIMKLMGDADFLARDCRELIKTNIVERLLAGSHAEARKHEDAEGVQSLEGRTKVCRLVVVLAAVVLQRMSY